MIGSKMGRELLLTLAKEYLKEAQDKMDPQTQSALKEQLKKDWEIKRTTHKVTAIGMALMVGQTISNVQLQVHKIFLS